MVGLLTIEHHHLFTVEDITVSRLGGGGLTIMERKATLALDVSKGTQYLTTDDAGQLLSLLRLTAGALDQPAKQHHRGEVRFNH